MIKVGVIGVGVMGSNHVRVLRDVEGADLVAISDADPARGDVVGARYGITAVDDHRKLLERFEPDVVIVSVPTRLHHTVAMDAIASGAHVLIEKPIASSIAEAKELIAAAESAGVKLAVGHIERFNPAVVHLKERLDAGELGNVFLIHSRRLSPFPNRIMDVGVSADLASHEIDMMRYLTGSEVEHVSGAVSQVLHPTHEDIVFGLLRFESGALGILDVNWVTPTKIRDISITGARGMFQVNYLTQELYYHANAAVEVAEGSDWRPGTGFSVTEGSMIRYHVAKREPLLVELESFLDAVRDDRRPVVDGRDGLEALFVADRIVAVGREAGTTVHRRVVA